MEKTKVEIINETVEFYKRNPRSLRTSRSSDGSRSSANCVYRNSEGHKCAFSRCCTPEGVDILESNCNGGAGVAAATHTLKMEVDDLLAPEYHGHQPEFWSDIQNLHDNANYWSAEGAFTYIGEKAVAELIRTYGE